MPTTQPAINCCLLVDDHAGMRHLLRDLLTDEVHHFVECSDGSASLPAFEKHQPQIVLMDVEMPDMDGLTATRKIMAQYPEALIVILTQHDSPAIKRAALAAGASAFVCKSNLYDLPRLLSSEIAKESPPGQI